MKHRRTSKPDVERRTLGYVRVSTEDQARDGVSLDAQEARIGAYAVALGWNVSEVIRDPGCSAKDLRRPGIGKILDAIKRGEVERVIITRLDRITRSVRDLADLIDLCAKHDTALVSISESLDTGSASGRMAVGLLGLLAQWQRETIGENTGFALAHKRAQRTAYGRTPFGYRREGDALIPEPSEQAARAEAVRMDRAGSSFREIGRFLTSSGARAKTWHASSVRAMLRSRMTCETVPA
jgi:DNA invertase Pin-like site-specific DNA recombinase